MADINNSDMDQDVISKSPEDSVLLTQIKQLDKRFYYSCRQVVLLNNQIEELKARYDRAVIEDRSSFICSLSMRIATLEGIRNMFYEYVCSRSDLLDSLHEELLTLGVIDYDMDMSGFYEDE